MLALGATPRDEHFLEQHFALYPLETVAALRAASKHGSDEILREKELFTYHADRFASIAASYGDYLNGPLASWKAVFDEGTTGYVGGFDRRFMAKSTAASDPLRAIHPTALAAMRDVSTRFARDTSDSTRTSFAQFVASMSSDGLRYELMFEVAAKALFCPSCSECLRRFRVVVSVYDVPNKKLVDEFREASSEKMLVKLPPNSENVDFYLLEKSGDGAKQVLAVAVQLTTNANHLPTHKAFFEKPRSFLKTPKTMFEQLRDAGADEVRYLYVTSESLLHAGLPCWTKLENSSRSSITMLIKNGFRVDGAKHTTADRSLTVYRATISDEKMTSEFNKCILHKNAAITSTTRGRANNKPLASNHTLPLQKPVHPL
jgi:hypothetical protein